MHFELCLLFISGCGVFDPLDKIGEGGTAPHETGETGDTGTETDTDTAPDTGIGSLDADNDGYSESGGDCDDTNAAINPAAMEVCNEVDDDCDRAVDEDVTTTFYADTDGDGYGDSGGVLVSCVLPTGYVEDATDCKDADVNIHPDAVETCNEVDDNCDGTADEGVTTTYYVDMDGDRYGAETATLEACALPTGYSALSTDCNDIEAAINPAAMEVCDGQDNNCDEQVDDSGSEGETLWYTDADEDGYGDANSGTLRCDGRAMDEVEDASDCNDADRGVNPAAEEICDGQDNNCDGAVDDNAARTATTFYADADADGYGNVSRSQEACAAPAGYVADATDCNDTDSAINPAAMEVCDGDDNDCDGTAAAYVTCYTDADGDGYSTGSNPVDVCEVSECPSGTSPNVDGECDDTDGEVFPGAEEWCDGVDQDCDGTADNDAQDASVWYADADADGYGDVATYDWSCDQPVGYVATAGDYDLVDASVHWSPCQESLVLAGFETHLEVPEYSDSIVTITVSTPVDFVETVLIDGSDYWISCGEVVSGGSVVMAPYSEIYYTSSWNAGSEGTWYPSYTTALSRDGSAFTNWGAYGTALLDWRSYP